MKVAIEFRKVSKHFGRIKAVDQVDLKIREGEFFSILGPSGSGKTTCLRLIGGFERPDSGQLLMGSQDVSFVPPYQRNVNTVFQSYALFPNMTVAENIGYGLRIRKVSVSDRRKQVEEMLSLVHLPELTDKKPNQLSGGQRQRVALARALINRPKILLLDEPLGALDLKLRQAMKVELKSIQRKVGITFVYVTHDQGEALSMSDRLGIFNAGNFEQIGTPEEIYEVPKTAFAANFVGASTTIPAAVAKILTGQDRAFILRPEHVRIQKQSPGRSPASHRPTKSPGRSPAKSIKSINGQKGKLAAKSAADQFQLEGIVRSRNFSGMHVYYEVEAIFSDGNTSLSSQPLPLPLIEALSAGDIADRIESGDAVQLSWQRQNMRYLNDSPT